ncbi:FtsK/SpoIIIE domain-containing protein [Pseudonocardia sp. D17]|uniref:FtsK/SpoIIIE domain-containing protein n=1 Tax=Pseudonocardia sp. D17 TaxID=882661 RepID=UPI0030CB933B
MARRPGRRERIVSAFADFADAVEAALRGAGAARDEAVRAHARAMLELWLRTDGLDAARADEGLAAAFASAELAPVVARVEADHAAAFDTWQAGGPAALRAVFDEAAPGAAGDDPDRWIGDAGKDDGTDGVPRLWRIGHASVAGGESFPVGVPLLDDSHLQVVSAPDCRATAEALVEALLVRVLSYFRPGLVAVHVWDVGQFTGSLPGLYPLTSTGLLTVHDPGRLPALLEELSDRIRRVHTRVLVDGHPSLRALAAETDGRRTEPWLVAVLVGNRTALSEDDHRQLQRVARGGLACGISLVLLDVPVTLNAAVETVDMRPPRQVRTSMTGPHVDVRLDRPLPRDKVVAAGIAISRAHEEWRSRVGTFADLLPPPAEWGTGRGERGGTAAGVHAPVGFAEGLRKDLVLADGSPHALIGGPSGTGKTNLLLTMIGSMAARYSPHELEFYLLDFKEGVSFAQFAPGRRDTTWLPHARLVGVNVNTDREFGLALLRFLSDEMRRRADAAKEHEVTKLEELRHRDPHGHWPRIVAVIDEFQYLFAERDDVTRAATQLLEDVARRGRSQGIHLVLASQDVSGIEAFWGRPAIFEQFVLRVALPRARRVLADLNDAALDLPRWHAVLNHESGIKHGNEIVRIPDAAQSTLALLQQRLHDDHAAAFAPPVLFDGARAPRYADLADRLPAAGGGATPRALVGQVIDVAASPATVALPDAPARNIAVLGAGASDALAVLAAATASLRDQYAPGEVDVVLVPLVVEAVEPARRMAARLAGHVVTTVGLDGVRERVETLAADVTARLSGGPRRPVHLVLLGGDAADHVLDRPGTEALRRILHFGPETGVHVLGWWRSVGRLRTLLTLGAAPDDIGAWVALDVQGSELGPLGPGLLQWAPRPGRGLFFDRAQHARPQVVLVPEPEQDQASRSGAAGEVPLSGAAGEGPLPSAPGDVPLSGAAGDVSREDRG